MAISWAGLTKHHEFVCRWKMVGCVIMTSRFEPTWSSTVPTSRFSEKVDILLTKRLLGDHPADQGDAFETGKDPQ